MGEIKDYKVKIVERTKELLVNYYPNFERDEREVTFLMNCLLGLIIAVTENEKESRKLLRGKIDGNFIDNIPDKLGFIESKKIKQDLTAQDLTEISVNVCHKPDLIGKDKLWLLSKIRNCIAHQNIFAINEYGKWIGVRLWNLQNSKKDFEIVFTISELKSYAIDLADKFIQTYN